MKVTKKIPPGKYMYMRREHEIIDGKIVWKFVERGPVRLMASADFYSMVRNPGCIPFVVQNKDICIPL